jgi:hypothetical protein
MRTALAALCVLLVLSLAGCGSTLDEGPNTPVEIMYIRATLPGTDWHKAGEGKAGPLDTERWENGDGTLFFRVSTDPDEALDYPSVRGTQVDRYIALMGLPPSTLVAGAMFMGRNAVRIEGVSPDDEDFRTIDFVFIAGLRHFYVGAGATGSSWGSGNADTVFDILNSVKVAIVK